MSFSLTERQKAARDIIIKYQHAMLFGGSRSGKTFLAVYATIVRAIASPGSRHLIARLRYNSVKMSIIYDTFPAVMQLAFPQIPYTINKTDAIAYLNDGTEIHFAGLDDKKAIEKVLGREYATIYLNECSEIPWFGVGMLLTRLAQTVNTLHGNPLPLKMIYDCNPPEKSHWTYKLFVKGQDPLSGDLLRSPDKYGCIQLNPSHNLDNLPADYIDSLRDLSPAQRIRFLEGNFRDTNQNALFDETAIEQYRVAEAPESLKRVVVAVDPSGAGSTEDTQNDAIGIVVVGIDVNNIAYILHDGTVLAGPNVWGKTAVNLYAKYKSDIIVAEKNFGGAMVEHVIRTADPNVKFKFVTSSRGKFIRAEPFSPLVSDGRVRFVDKMPELEEELAGFSISGYVGERSPNRADALIFALAELFPHITSGPKKEVKVLNIATVNHW